MHRTFKSFALAAALAAASGVVAAQDFVFGWNPRSGDVWVDTYLHDINGFGYRQRDRFIDEVVRNYGAPRPLVVELLDRRWAPGDIYMACNIASILGRPCRHVVDEWDRDHGQGWGVIAKRMGIKPGSPEFHRLKRGFVPTYDRWGRTITLDAALQSAFPDRVNKDNSGKGHAAHGGGKGKSSGAARPSRDSHGPGKGGGKARHDGRGSGKAAQGGGHARGKGQEGNGPGGTGKRGGTGKGG